MTYFLKQFVYNNSFFFFFFGYFLQKVSEKVGGAEGTKLDDDFKEMERVSLHHLDSLDVKSPSILSGEGREERGSCSPLVPENASYSYKYSLFSDYSKTENVKCLFFFFFVTILRTKPP